MKKNSFWRFSKKEREYVLKTLDEGVNGKMNIRLEKEFSKKFKSRYVVSVNSCTSALHASMLALGIKENDEVILPPLTFIATTFAPIYVGAIPVFADIDSDTFNIDPHSIEKKISKKTKAIIAVSIYGLPPNLIKIKKIAKKYSLYLIEDNAECVLGKVNGKITGSFGDISVYSFQRSKHLTSGDGGIATIKNKKIATLFRKYTDLGYRRLTAEPITNENFKDEIQSPTYKRHELIGHNFRMPEVCAAIALAQLKKINYFLNKRIKCGIIYKKIIDKCEWLVAQKVDKNYFHTYWTFVFKIDHKKVDISWKKFREVFIKNGGDKFYGAWKLSYQELCFYQKSIDKYKFSDVICPVAESIQPYLIQLKTNYKNMQTCKKQANALKKTINYFEKNLGLS